MSLEKAAQAFLSLMDGKKIVFQRTDYASFIIPMEGATEFLWHFFYGVVWRWQAEPIPRPDVSESLSRVLQFF